MTTMPMITAKVTTMVTTMIGRMIASNIMSSDSDDGPTFNINYIIIS